MMNFKKHFLTTLVPGQVLEFIISVNDNIKMMIPDKFELIQTIDNQCHIYAENKEHIYDICINDYYDDEYVNNILDNRDNIKCLICKMYDVEYAVIGIKTSPLSEYCSIITQIFSAYAHHNNIDTAEALLSELSVIMENRSSILPYKVNSVEELFGRLGKNVYPVLAYHYMNKHKSTSEVKE